MKYKILPPQAIHEIGQRSNQEDTIFPSVNDVSAESRLFMVCDGMGGHESGEVASSTVCQAISEYMSANINTDEIFTEEMFRDVLAHAYERLNEKDNGEEKKMGTTLTFVYFHRGGCMAAHIGDSRIYHIRPSKNEILYRSRDHSLVYDLFEAGEISEEEMRTSPQKNIITRCMMPGQEEPSKADIVNIRDVRPDDYFFLCSDGMLENMSDAELLSIISDQNETDEMKVATLKKYTSANKDNHSAWLIHIDEVTKELIDEQLGNDVAEIEENTSDETMIPLENNIEMPNATETEQSSSRHSGILKLLMSILVLAVLAFSVSYLLSARKASPTPAKSEISEFDSPHKKSSATKVRQLKQTPKLVVKPVKKEVHNINKGEATEESNETAKPMTFGNDKQEKQEKQETEKQSKSEENNNQKVI